MAITLSHSWSRDAITPDLVTAVGIVTLEWARVETTLMRMLLTLMSGRRVTERDPFSFDNRMRLMGELADALFERDEEERRLFRWFVARVKNLNGLRDSITHGIPGMLTVNGRTFPGLFLLKPSGKVMGIPMTQKAVEILGTRLVRLGDETGAVHSAIIAALNASTPGLQVMRPGGGWMKPDWESRSPKLPRWVSVPSTFQG